MNKAVAMKYKVYEDNAPKVIAKGTGEVAKKIIANQNICNDFKIAKRS